MQVTQGAAPAALNFNLRAYPRFRLRCARLQLWIVDPDIIAKAESNISFSAKPAEDAAVSLRESRKRRTHTGKIYPLPESRMRKESSGPRERLD